MADSKGRIVATLKSGGKFFRYSFLPAEEQTMAKIYFNDPWLKAINMQPAVNKDGQMTIIENIYYEYQKWDLGPQAIITLNKVAEIMQDNPDLIILLMAHTDSRGSTEFNMDLSQKRAQAAVDYIVSKGIDRGRLTAKGMGESQLVNRCKDGVDCSEDEHAQNRRTEFRVKRVAH
jgi:outer membrane protein OmpA-like peptidoglycan-associated protein